MELPAPPESSEVSIAVHRAPKHRTTTPFRDFWAQVAYLMGRIGLIVLLMMTAIILMVASIVAATWLFVVIMKEYVGT
jgi:hypothetical protein